MLNRLAASSLALALTIAGMPLCGGMDMDTTGTSGHVCADADTRPGATDDAPRNDASMPDSACCMLGSVPGPRPPAERVPNAPNDPLPMASALAPVSTIPTPNPILLSTADPPGSSSLARHLFFCVFLI